MGGGDSQQSLLPMSFCSHGLALTSWLLPVHPWNCPSVVEAVSPQMAAPSSDAAGRTSRDTSSKRLQSIIFFLKSLWDRYASEFRNFLLPTSNTRCIYSIWHHTPLVSKNNLWSNTFILAAVLLNIHFHGNKQKLLIVSGLFRSKFATKLFFFLILFQFWDSWRFVIVEKEKHTLYSFK